MAVIGCLTLCRMALATEISRPPIQVLSVGQEHMFYNTGRDGCDKYDIPDEGARAFRDASGTIHLFMTTAKNRAFLGPDFDHLKRNCAVVYQGGHKASPGAYDESAWLTSPFAQGNTVYSLIHNEFHAWEVNKNLCKKTTSPGNCSEVSISEAVSNDGGNHFKRIDGFKGVVASMPYRFTDPGHWHGYIGPSSIVKHDGYYYSLVSMIHPNERPKNGVCVLRTTNLAEPNSWRGWDGHEFSVKTSVDPYNESLGDTEARRCPPLPRNQVMWNIGSLGWSPIRQSFLLVELVPKGESWVNGEVPGIYLAESKDMVHWSKPVLLLSVEQSGRDNLLYPSIIDPSSTDQNFSTIGNNFLLYTFGRIQPHGYEAFSIFVRNVKLKQ